jgi:26 proteasome complex subunit DSS1
MASTDPKTTDDKPVEQKPEQKPAALGEDDEFEDFPVDGTSTPICTPSLTDS